VIKKPFLHAGIVKSVKPEHCIWSRKHYLVLVASEAKGLEASIHQCVGMLLIACGDSALYLQMLGLDLENCVVPGIAISDTTIQFGAVYLIPHSFPVFLFLSDMLHPLYDSEMVACWFFRLSAFSKQTEELLNNAKVKALRQESKETRKNQPKKRSKIEEKSLPIKFDEQKNFMKPIREGYRHSLRHGEAAEEGSFLPGLGAEILLQQSVTNHSQEQRIAESIRNQVMAIVRRQFRPEFLNRLDDIIMFQPLGLSQLRQIVQMHIKLIAERFKIVM
jgi:hypothetical protein